MMKRLMHHRLRKSTLTQIQKKWKKTKPPFTRTETTSMLQLRIKKKNLAFSVRKIVPTTAEALILRCKIPETELFKKISSSMHWNDKFRQLKISKTDTMMPMLFLSNLSSRSRNQSHRNLLRATTIMQIFISLRRPTSNEGGSSWLNFVTGK